jgi:hypothetical protein
MSVSKSHSQYLAALKSLAIRSWFNSGYQNCRTKHYTDRGPNEQHKSKKGGGGLTRSSPWAPSSSYAATEGSASQPQECSSECRERAARCSTAKGNATRVARKNAAPARRSAWFGSRRECAAEGLLLRVWRGGLAMTAERGGGRCRGGRLRLRVAAVAEWGRERPGTRKA